MMGQVNVNLPPPPRGTLPPPPPARWPIYVFIILVVIVLAAVAVTRLVSNQHNSTAADPTATPTAVPAATSAVPAILPSATSTVPAGAPTSTPGPANVATATPVTGSAGGQPPPPTNPGTLHVASGSCTSHSITWRWSGAHGATSYEVALYDPRTGATIKDTTTAATSYTLLAGPGARVALKVRSHNGSGAASDYFTPGSVGHVPFITTNPTHLTETTTGHTLTWFWTGARHAIAYDFVLYHYTGSVAHNDIPGRTDQGHWAIKVTPGIKYYLKVRSVGACPPSTFFTPPAGAEAGA